ncbi:hypothetical protein Tco_0794819 [Tanacetum coccineum]
MKMRQYIAITDHILWDIITNGNQTTTDPASPSVSAPKTSLAANARRNNEKALNILLSAILIDIFLSFHDLKDAKILWKAIKQDLEETKSIKEDAKKNLSLPSVWHVVATMIRGQPGLDELDFDDLYNNLKVYEHELKGVSNSSSPNIAFLSTEVKGSTLKQSTHLCLQLMMRRPATIDEDAMEENDIRVQKKISRTSIFDSGCSGSNDGDKTSCLIFKEFQKVVMWLFEMTPKGKKTSVIQETQFPTLDEVRRLSKTAVHFVHHAQPMHPEERTADKEIPLSSADKLYMMKHRNPKKISQAIADESCVKLCKKELLQFKLQSMVLCDLPEGKRQGYRQEEVWIMMSVAPVAELKQSDYFLAFASFHGFHRLSVDVKSAYLYGNITEEVSMIGVSCINCFKTRTNGFLFVVCKISSPPKVSSSTVLSKGIFKLGQHDRRSTSGDVQYLEEDSFRGNARNKRIVLSPLQKQNMLFIVFEQAVRGGRQTQDLYTDHFPSSKSTALAAEEEHSTSPHSKAASSARDARGSPTQSAAHSQRTASVQGTASFHSTAVPHDSDAVQGTATSQGTAEIQRTADFQGTAEPHDAASIPKSPNDYTPTDASQTSGGDEGLLDIYALNRGELISDSRANLSQLNKSSSQSQAQKMSKIRTASTDPKDKGKGILFEEPKKKKMMRRLLEKFKLNGMQKKKERGISMITELQVIDSPDGEYLIIHRENNHFRAFDTLWEILHVLDRQDLYHLYRVVDDYYEHIPPTGLGLMLLGDLNIIWETAESSDDDFWKDQEEWEIIRWRFHESSGVHTLEIEDGTMIHMLAERRYPLSRELMIRMLDHGMEVEDETETAITLIHLFILWTTEDGENS